MTSPSITNDRPSVNQTLPLSTLNEENNNQPVSTDEVETNDLLYEKLVREFKIDPYVADTQDLTINNPLSQDDKSIWKQYFLDKELKATINQDVRRTCPEISFFHNPRVSDTLLQILFAHSRSHHNTPYRQGMHEILAAIVYNLHLEGTKVNECKNANAIFEKIMDHLKQWYDIKDNNVTKKRNSVQNEAKQPFQKAQDLSPQSNEIVLRVNQIFEQLKNYDRFLHCKLQELDIDPHIYGIRWLRLLFGREIPFECIPIVWTVIFCFDEHFKFVDYFFVALLMELGNLFLVSKRDYSSCLQLLMQHNVISNAEHVLRRALAIAGRQLKPASEEPQSNTKRAETSRMNIEQDQASSRKEYIKQQQQTVPKQKTTNQVVEPKRLLTPTSTTTTGFSQENAHNSRPLARNSSSNTSFAQQLSTKINTNLSNSSLSSELDTWPERSVRQQLEDSRTIQKYCAYFMDKFLDQLQTRICELTSPNEDELLISLSGLKQICNVLSGKLTFDSEALQTLVNYKPKTVKQSAPSLNNYSSEQNSN
ncbi:unnamed protein product [Didymodactylos carnosus]|uniref:Rab-GAP TBC domain-containing protein n=1 Tax=Didymodactylos carnosus TaxID=1234261 RepID=A0A813UNG9_9BILA|nr:unnamed protein product [Didymodactylos carnosus]CAF1115669.1 unnamed protein product [Didymodactylos carnosus]CAF3619365.1 unnamed protein product [Didymodactylos carnosus]CAF3885834.1 unnamed protein product [Didymodactylos carnosus]